jgi:hypothetical protein
MLRPHRAPPSEAAQRWVYPKIIIFVAGAAIGLLGIVSKTDWLVTLAVAVLAVGVILRMMTRDRDVDADVDADADADAD